MEINPPELLEEVRAWLAANPRKYFRTQDVTDDLLMPYDGSTRKALGKVFWVLGCRRTTLKDSENRSVMAWKRP